MIRNNPEYMLPDGSPRFGIRTIGLDTIAEAPARPTQITVAQTADAASMLDAAELKLAAQHRYVLDRFKQDAEVISTLRETHPEELKLAEAAVAARLGSPKVWIRGAVGAYSSAVTDRAERDGSLFAYLVNLLMSLGLSLAVLVIVIGMMVLKVPPLPFLGVGLVLWLTVIPAKRKIERKLASSNLPTDVDRTEAQIFWDDVVNATFLAVLQNRDIAVDLATVAALTRGWNHTRYVASVAQELRTNHAQP